MAKDFETFAEREYLGAVCRADEDVDIQLAGVRYVATRVVPEQEGCLRELLDMQSVDSTRREVDAGCVDALLVTTDDALDTGRFLAHAASHRRTRTTGYKLVEDAMRRLGNTGNAALLAELARADREPAEIRKLTRILVRVSRIAPPESVGTLVRCTPQQRAEVVEAWARDIRAAGGLPPQEPAEPKPPES